MDDLIRTADSHADGPDDMAAHQLEARLDALGRGLVSSEARRAQPPKIYLEAVTRRRLFVNIRIWTPRLALAAAVLIAGAVVLIRSAGTPAPYPPGPIAENNGLANVSGETPTVARLTRLNHDMGATDLRLPAPAASGSSASNAEPATSAADSRSPQRIDALLRER